MVQLNLIHLSKDVSYIFFSVLITAFVVVISYQLWSSSKTSPRPYLEEGFAGPVNGASEIMCGGKIVEAVRLYTMFSGKTSSTETGSDDLLELKELLGKLSCLKQDLLATGSLVNAPYVTSQDIEPVSETVARCFAKTVPKRDLEISLDKWSKRGDMLVRRLCTSYNLADSESKEARALLSGLVADITDILMTVCLKGPVTIAGEEGPRMVQGREAVGTMNMGTYNGYY